MRLFTNLAECRQQQAFVLLCVVCVFIKRRNECLPIRDGGTELGREERRKEEDRHGDGGPASAKVPIETSLSFLASVEEEDR